MILPRILEHGTFQNVPGSASNPAEWVGGLGEVAGGLVLVKRHIQSRTGLILNARKFCDV